jgi:FAD synthase
VKLLEFRRPEKKFDSFEELSKAMHEDLEAGKTYEK